jgi:succinate dehydrogenase / fumarate reductase membrane anchor subunit
MKEVHLKLLQYLSGIVILVLLGIHMILMHLDDVLRFFGKEVGDVRSWGSVSERASSAGWLIFYIILLALVIYHALYGLRVIISELSISTSKIKALNWILIIFGIAIFAYAIYIPISSY